MLLLPYRQILQLVTFGVLIYGIVQFKVFLNQNFIEHDTKLKSSVNRALNGQMNYSKKLQ
jgi:hypothetical protein